MKKSRLLGAVYVFIAYGLSAFNAQASVIISPVAATASSEFSSLYDIGNTIDQSGLSAGFVSGVTDFDAYLGGNPTHTDGAANFEWFAAEGTTSAMIVYDLGSVYSIDRLALWNEESSGIGSFDISVSLDNVTFAPIASGLTPADNPLSVDYAAEVFTLGAQSARYIQLDVGGCPQPDGDPRLFCAIGEVAFSTSAVPVPAAVWLFGSGLLGLVGIARRKKA